MSNVVVKTPKWKRGAVIPAMWTQGSLTCELKLTAIIISWPLQPEQEICGPLSRWKHLIVIPLFPNDLSPHNKLVYFPKQLIDTLKLQQKTLQVCKSQGHFILFWEMNTHFSILIGLVKKKKKTQSTNDSNKTVVSWINIKVLFLIMNFGLCVAIKDFLYLFVCICLGSCSCTRMLIPCRGSTNLVFTFTWNVLQILEFFKRCLQNSFD